MFDNTFLAWDNKDDDEQGKPIAAYKPDIASEIDQRNGWDGDELTADDMTKFCQLIGPAFDYLLFAGQRNGKTHTNSMEKVAQRVHVMILMINPLLAVHKNFAALAKSCSLSRSSIGKHTRDFNACFGIYTARQKCRSVYGEDGGASGIHRSAIYSEAAKRGHQTRKRREQAAADNAKA